MDEASRVAEAVGQIMSRTERPCPLNLRAFGSYSMADPPAFRLRPMGGIFVVEERGVGGAFRQLGGALQVEVPACRRGADGLYEHLVLRNPSVRLVIGFDAARPEALVEHEGRLLVGLYRQAAGAAMPQTLLWL